VRRSARREGVRVRVSGARSGARRHFWRGSAAPANAAGAPAYRQRQSGKLQSRTRLASPVPTISVRYPVPLVQDAWCSRKDPCPSPRLTDAAVQRLKLLLDAWVYERDDRRASRGISRSVGQKSRPPSASIRRVRDRAGAGGRAPAQVSGLAAEHAVPRLCFEIVSETHPYKDYAGIQDRYAAMARSSSWCFDPLLAGPPKLGGPVLFQVWRRDASGASNGCISAARPPIDGARGLVATVKGPARYRRRS